MAAVNVRRLAAIVHSDMIGAFKFFEGLPAVIKDQFYVVGPNYAYHIDVTAYGASQHRTKGASEWTQRWATPRPRTQ